MKLAIAAAIAATIAALALVEGQIIVSKGKALALALEARLASCGGR
jgi:hypothetical protein